MRARRAADGVVGAPAGPGVAAWALVPAALGPTALVTGLLVAVQRQPSPEQAWSGSISALAGGGAEDPAVMASALAVLGLCHLGTAAGLRCAAPAGRALLALGGLATLAVVALPLPARGEAPGHLAAAAVAFCALTAWPLLAAPRAGSPRLRRAAAATTTVLAVLLAWLGTDLLTGSPLGLSERVVAVAQALVPLAAVLTVRRTSHRRRRLERGHAV